MALKIILSLVAVAVAVLLYRNRLETNRLGVVLAGLLDAESIPSVRSDLRVAVGFGSCVDVIGPGLEILNNVGAVPPDHTEHYDILHNMYELQRIFAYFFQHGAAAERYVANESLFDTLATEAQLIPGTKVAVGGNAPVMVNSFRREGVSVLLGAQMTDDLRHKIDPEVKVAGNKVDKDDIHLIMEYKKGEKWGDFEAPRANRFIVHNDANNPMLSSLEEFGKALISFTPHLVVIGGLQMMDGFPYESDQRRQRLDVLASILADLPAETRIHFEMASFAESACLLDIVETVVRYSDSLGMNEQELPNLLGILSLGSITSVADAYPRVASTLDQMRELYQLLSERRVKLEGKNHRRITRIHVHTLAFQAIMTIDGDSGKESLGWKNSGAAAAHASLVASRHTCGDRNVSISRSRLLLDESFSTSVGQDGRRVLLEPEKPVTCWNEKIDESLSAEICLAPVLVCTQVVQTVGGGDNISTAGLVLQI